MTDPNTVIRDKVEKALRQVELCDRLFPYAALAEAAIAAHLDALKAEGYTIMRPVTAEEEARNAW